MLAARAARAALRSTNARTAPFTSSRRFASSRVSPKSGRFAVTAVASGLAVSVSAYALWNSNESQLYAEAAVKAPAIPVAEIISVLAPPQLAEWDVAGVYTWGDNRGRAVAPDSAEGSIKQPTRMAFFEGTVLRDLKLSREAGVAVTDSGDVVQWGLRYAADIKTPEYTLRGKNIKKVELSEDTIIALSTDGTVYTLPISKHEQLEGVKPRESGWFGLPGSTSPLCYRKLEPPLKMGERISEISSGKNHLVLLSTSGRVFTAASSLNFPERGQLGIKGLNWKTRFKGAYDHCYEVKTESKIQKIATGDFHTVLLDIKGQVMSFGDNTSGQCGFDYTPASAIIQEPTTINIKTDEIGSHGDLSPVCRDISAGGNSSFFIVNAFGPNEKVPGTEVVLSCGRGLGGSLGNGKWAHCQGSPTRLKALSGLFEFDERLNRRVPIRVSYISTGDAHSAAVLDNGCEANSGLFGNRNASAYGSDVLVWGHNEYHQLGTGKRNNSSLPMHISPLDQDRRLPVEKDALNDTYRFQVWPKAKMKVVNGTSVEVEQKIYCGEATTAVYCKSRK